MGPRCSIGSREPGQGTDVSTAGTIRRMTGAIMDKPRNTDSPKPAPQHTVPNEAGIPRSKEELDALSREFVLKHRVAFDALGS